MHSPNPYIPKPSKSCRACSAGQRSSRKAEQFCKGHPVLSETLDYMRTLYTALSSLGLDDRLMVDFGLVQRNDYYTGVVFAPMWKTTVTPF